MLQRMYWVLGSSCGLAMDPRSLKVCPWTKGVTTLEGFPTAMWMCNKSTLLQSSMYPSHITPQPCVDARSGSSLGTTPCLCLRHARVNALPAARDSQPRRLLWAL